MLYQRNVTKLLLNYFIFLLSQILSIVISLQSKDLKGLLAMSSQFTNGYPSSDLRLQYPVISHSAHSHLDQSGGHQGSFNHSK